jgi:GntR family transcriptional regulator
LETTTLRPPFVQQHRPNVPVHVPLYVCIQHEIRSGILSGTYGAGDRIPSESELARQFKTTRATVARALQELVFDGTIIRRVGAGSFVASGAGAVQLDPKRLRSFEEQAAETGETVEYRLVSFSLVSIPPASVGPLRAEPGSKSYHLERLRLVKGVPLSLESRFIPQTIGAGIAVGDLGQRSMHYILESGLGHKIVRIEASVRAATATSRIARLLEIPKGRPLLIRDHLLVDRQDQPIVHGTSFYTEQFRLNYVVHESADRGA